MLINELQGYKQNTIYNKARELYDPDVRKTTGYGVGLTRSFQMKKFVDFLKQQGFEKIGKDGSFAAVFERAGYPWLFKIFNNDRAYLTYIKWVIDHQSNPNVPKIRGKLIKINDNTFAVRMEKLKPLLGSNYDSKLVSLLDSNPRTWADNQIEYIKDNYPGIIQIVDELKKHNWKFDMHHNNIMMRGNIPVIIDPVADMDNLEEAILIELQGYKKNPIYKQAKKVFHPDELDQLTMYPNDMHIGGIRTKFKNYMQKQGFKHLGGGSFADVYERSGYPWVFKLVIKDPSYLAYVNYCISHQNNPAVPKFRGKPIKLNEYTYVVRMENLTPITKGTAQIIKLINTLAGADHLSDLDQTKIEFLQQNFPDILRILTDIDKLGYEFDLNNDNFMMRGQTLVIIDPLFPEEDSASLMELTGYKNNPAYQQATTLLDPQAIASVSASTKPIQRISQITQFTNFLKQHGFDKLGSGSFGAVYEKPGYPWVFKIFTQDSAYLDFIKYVLSHQNNPSLPKLKGGLIKINPTTYCVRMEKLKPINNHNGFDYDTEKDLKTLMTILHRLTDLDLKNADPYNFIKNYFPDIFTIIQDLKGTWQFDIHADNIMLRGDTPVIIDPIYDTYGMENVEELNELRGYKSNPIFQTAVTQFGGINRYKGTISKLSRFNDELIKLNYVVDRKGWGSRGAVYKRPGDPYVIKIFHNDPGYTAYIKYAKAHQDNPHVPRIRGKLMKINSDTFAVRLEELQPVAGINPDGRYLVDLIIGTSMWGDLAEDGYIQTEEPLLHKLFVDLSALYGYDNGTDLLEANIMRRNQTIVITDPD